MNRNEIQLQTLDFNSWTFLQLPSRFANAHLQCTLTLRHASSHSCQQGSCFSYCITFIGNNPIPSQCSVAGRGSLPCHRWSPGRYTDNTPFISHKMPTLGDRPKGRHRSGAWISCNNVRSHRCNQLMNTYDSYMIHIIYIWHRPRYHVM